MGNDELPRLLGKNQLALARAPQAIGFAPMGNLDLAATAEQGRTVQRGLWRRGSGRPLGLRCWRLRFGFSYGRYA